LRAIRRQASSPTILLLIGILVLLSACDRDEPPRSPDAIVSYLASLLADMDPEVRRTAAEGLGKLGQPGATEALVKALDDPDPAVRQASAWALGQLGEDVAGRASWPLIGRLRDCSEQVRLSAAQAIAEIGETEAVVERLAQALKASDATTRRAAVHALLSLDAPPAYPALVEALRDDDAEVRQGAVAALGELADSRAIPLIRERLLHDPAIGVRAEAAFRLGKIGDRAAVADLEKVAADDADAGVRRWARWASEQISSSLDSGSAH
jgi:HEAT repeat protein